MIDKNERAWSLTFDVIAYPLAAILIVPVFAYALHHSEFPGLSVTAAIAFGIALAIYVCVASLLSAVVAGYCADWLYPTDDQQDGDP